MNINGGNLNDVYSPAFGKVIKINREQNGDYFIAIYLSPFDVHYQFSPINGIIQRVDYDASGKFDLAYDLNKSKNNEKNIYTIQTQFGLFKVYQIAGKLVRRITTFKKTNDVVTRGNLLGLIHFGSRVDIIIPNLDDNFNVSVKLGQYVCANTILGRYINKN